jgi:hypothetical protein
MSEHVFVTSQGHPYARFRRAIASGNLLIAEAAARDLQQLSLADALELCLLNRGEPERYERATATVDRSSDLGAPRGVPF